jgi:hypothetical protein
LFGDSGEFPLGVVVAIRLVGVDDVLPEFGHATYDMIKYIIKADILGVYNKITYHYLRIRMHLNFLK